MKKRVGLSWSGGKDSCMALDKLTKQGVEVACLITTIPIELGRTFGHGEKMELIKLQAKALNIPVEFISCTFEDYTSSFTEALKNFKHQYQLAGIAFGDLYLEGHREWGEQLANETSLEPIYPLWGKKEDALLLLNTFVKSGYKATVIRVREDVLDKTWLGRQLDSAFIQDITKKDCCPMGESGEYHTFVSDGPLFQARIELEQPEIIKFETTQKYEFQKIKLIPKE
ncbi:Dph6-related ATP pyrophosphatase [Cytobacillus massiliigabonensis]|uniref:Dph6-related ATP pyrophosphatase n=1 Tax=Cytobacillus massiliigabonensis TaxID=1871011 RepID=UPI000C817B31|nr:diphthine--ammonia ligase [Cytobacillus massiliigabonensis]